MQRKRRLQDRVTTCLIGCGFALAAFRLELGIGPASVLALCGSFFMAAGVYGSVGVVLPGRRASGWIDGVVFALSDATRALDEVASQRRPF